MPLRIYRQGIGVVLLKFARISHRGKFAHNLRHFLIRKARFLQGYINRFFFNGKFLHRNFALTQIFQFPHIF